MEGAPYTNESNADGPDSEQKKKKRLPRPSLETASSETDISRKAAPEYESLWQRLLKNQAETGPQEAEPDEVLSQLELADLPEDQELDELAGDESAAILERLAQARHQEVAPAGAAPMDPEVAAAIDFLELVANGHEAPNAAAAAVENGLSAPVVHEFSDDEAEIPLHHDVPAPPMVGGAGRGTGGIRPAARNFGGGLPAGPNVMPGFGLPEAAVATMEQPLGYSKSDVVGAAMVGGIVGYLLGRRRGRIKTEKRLMPVQKKLEKQVKALQTNLERQEYHVRQLAAEKAGQPLSAAGEKLREQVASGSEKSTRSSAGSPQERRQIGHVLAAAEIVAPVVAAGEAVSRAITGTKTAAETAPRPNARPIVETAAVKPLDKHVETLKQKDLLELSDKIIVEGTSLRQMYESHQIGEGALRRVVGEHLRGGNSGEALHRELTQHEIDFERDPMLRDRDHRQPSNTNQGSTTMAGLLQRADENFGFHDTTGQPNPGSKVSSVQSPSAADDQQRTLKMALTGVVVFLLLVVVFLIVTRG